MSAENNYEEILEDVCEKINSLDNIREVDVLDIKSSVEAIESLITDTQAKLNFQEIKEKLEKISDQVDNCNEALLKDLFNDINELRANTNSVGQFLENLQNVQNLALTSAEFEEFQKQQLDLALKTNENIFNELSLIKENSQVGDNSESIQRIETQLENLHKNLSTYIEQILAKVENVPNLDEVSGIMSDLSSVQHKSIKQTASLVKDLQAKFTTFETDFSNKDFENQLAKISEIYDSLSIIRTWVDKVGLINQAIDNVYARLGESIDFDEVAEKVDIIYESIGALNSWTMKIDNVDNAMSAMQSKIASLGTMMTDTKNISTIISSMKEKFDNTFPEELDFDDITNKMDIVYENLSAINEWASKVDVIQDKVISIDEWANKVEGIEEKVSTINNAFEDEMITSKIDLIYENIGLLNEWVSKIDNIATHSDELDSKISEINENLSNASKIIEDVPNLKDQLETLSGELNAITRTTRNDDADSYIYTLLDIESDFLKLHKFLDDKTNTTTQDINSLKEKFEEINNDISSISIRTNKLILSADDANKEFKTYLETFRSTIDALELQRTQFNPELKFSLLNEKITELFKLIQNSVAASRNLNTAFVYLAEWIDATGSVLNNMNVQIAKIKANTEKEDKTPELYNGLKEEIKTTVNRISQVEDTLDNIKNDDISEIKSLLTGVMVQLNAIPVVDVDTINEKIDKLTAQNNEKFTELEIVLKEKVNQQAQQISMLEDKINDLNSKFDKLIEVMVSEQNNYEVRDAVNYVASQTSALIEKIENSQINVVAEKLSSFDENINKIVSYIEED